MKRNETASSRRKKAFPPPTYALTPEESAARFGPGPEILRRVLLGFVTALIVARPLVLGEDPGLSSRLTDATSMVLSTLWLVAAVGWAAWRAWSRQGAWYGGWIEAGLLVVVGIVFASATWAASYRHPAFLIGWEWIILLVVFSLVRQLARTQGENQRLLAAVLASGVSLSLYAVYQYGVEMPDLRESQAATMAEDRHRIAEQGGSVEEYERDKAAETKRVAENNVYATFAHPNAFAGYLALLLPAALGAFWVCWRSARLSWHTVMVLAAAALLAIGLWLTHSRGAVLAVLIAAAAFSIAKAIKDVRSGNRTWALTIWTGCGVLLAIIISLFSKAAEKPALEAARQSFEKRLEYWSATWKMITDQKHAEHFWLGVGPGNFSRFHPRNMSETAHEYIIDPHNFALEMWATTGVLGMAALLVTLALLFWKLRKGSPENQTSIPPGPNNGFATRWEFYFGGMAGLILGFLLSSLPASSDSASQAQFILSGIVAGARAIVWFAAFALFETVPWSKRTKRLAVGAGIAALLLNLCVSAGIALPAVAQPLWFMAALAVNTRAARPAWTARSWIGVILPLPLLTAACLYYVIVIYVPVSTSVSSWHAAMQNFGLWTSSHDPQWQQSLKEGTAPGYRLAVLSRNKQFLEGVILPRLIATHHQDPRNVLPLIDLATWYGERWKLAPEIQSRASAAGYAHLAAHLDPQGREPYYAQYRLNLLFGNHPQTGTEKLFGLAADALAHVVYRDPTSAPLRCKYADILFRAGRNADGRLQAEAALRLDAVSNDQTRRLTSAERTQSEKWLRK